MKEYIIIKIEGDTPENGMFELSASIKLPNELIIKILEHLIKELKKDEL